MVLAYKRGTDPYAPVLIASLQPAGQERDFCPNRATNIPFGQRASSRTRLAVRIEKRKNGADRRHPLRAIEGAELNFLIVPAGVQRLSR
jgi:hypothetical protein